jgi:hypothetical protein
LRIIKSQARKDGLFLIVEGRGGQNYLLYLKSPRKFKAVEGVKIGSGTANEQELQISFDDGDNSYHKREILLPDK